MTAAGEDILAWTEKAITRREEAAQNASPGPWVPGGIGDYGWTVYTGARTIETEDSEIGRADARHIALHGPGLVLRRCAADRKLLALHGGRAHSCPVIDSDGDLDVHARLYDHEVCDTIRALAEGYGWTEGQR